MGIVEKTWHFAQLKDNFPRKQPGGDQAIAGEAQELIAEQSVRFMSQIHALWRDNPHSYLNTSSLLPATLILENVMCFLRTHSGGLL